MSRRAGVVWLVLVLATALTWFVGGGAVTGRAAAAVVVVLAFAKAALVGHEFMELRHARAPERVLFGAWIVAVGGACTLLVVL